MLIKEYKFKLNNVIIKNEINVKISIVNIVGISILNDLIMVGGMLFLEIWIFIFLFLERWMNIFVVRSVVIILMNIFVEFIKVIGNILVIFIDFFVLIGIIFVIVGIKIIISVMVINVGVNGFLNFWFCVKK